MKMRQLTSDLTVSALGLGCMGMVDFYGTSNEKDASRVLDVAYARGVNFFDTADVYGNGVGEELLGRLIAKNRQHIFLSTKCGFIKKGGNTATDLHIDASANHIKEACEKSLKRLGVDTIDLYLLHRVDPNLPIEESIYAMSELVKSGKIRFIGVCAVDTKTLQRAQKVHPITVLQDEYSLLHREPENELLPFCGQHKIGFVPYSPLCRGLLTGTISTIYQFKDGDVRQHLPRFQKDNLAKNLQFVSRLKEIAAEKGCSVSQLALAWLLEQQDFIVPIPGAKTIIELEENLGAVEIQLTYQDIDTINKVFPSGCAFGNQYSDLLRNSQKHQHESG